MTDTLQIRHVPIGDLKGADWNPRWMIEKDMLKLVRSLDEFGIVEPIVVNTRSGLVPCSSGPDLTAQLELAASSSNA